MNQYTIPNPYLKQLQIYNTVLDLISQINVLTYREPEIIRMKVKELQAVVFYEMKQTESKVDD